MAEGQTFDKSDNMNYASQDYSTSIEYFDKRLTIAKECQDQIGQRRAHASLGDIYLHLEDFDKALDHYREALTIDEIKVDDLFIAQISFIIGCIYNIKQEYKSAIYFHEKHLNLAQQYQDSNGQCQAYFILSQLYDNTNQFTKGKKYRSLHTALEREIKESNEIKATTKPNLNKNLRTESISLSIFDSQIPLSIRSNSAVPDSFPDDKSIANTNKKVKTGSFIQNLSKKSSLSLRKQSSPTDTDDLANLVDRMQKSRFDDQRCEIKKSNTKKPDLPGQRNSTQLDDILNTIDRLQQFRLDDQRTTFPSSTNHNNGSRTSQQLSVVNEKFLDLLAKSQNSRMNDQRAVLAPLSSSSPPIQPMSTPVVITTNTCLHESKTLPDEEMLFLLNRLQSRYTNKQYLSSSASLRTRMKS
ncbi:unnamed protein product [Adineta steineri]|uniref:Uncharacterized protein n=1 Tax=Adineta steineri TaxID=433720 RepID=A0A814ZSX5_9BILA|nr:unnamed protein product [Adineta steineri]CAF1246404.1 unnamed protein product [Adineta steineri]